MCKQEGGGVIARSYDKSRDNALPTLLAYAGLQKRGAYLRDNKVLNYVKNPTLYLNLTINTKPVLLLYEYVTM